MGTLDTSVAACVGTGLTDSARDLLVYLRDHARDEVGAVRETTRRGMIAQRAASVAGLPLVGGWRGEMQSAYLLSAVGFVLDDDGPAAIAACLLAANVAATPRSTPAAHDAVEIVAATPGAF